MKKLVAITFCAMAMAGAAKAQTPTNPAVKVELSEESQTKPKSDREIEEGKIFSLAGFSADEVVKFREVIKEMGQKSKELNGSSLSDAEKEAKKKELAQEKKQKMIAVVGPDKFKSWMNARKQVVEAKKAETN